MTDYDDYLMKSYHLRDQLVGDKFRPKYHFIPPEGQWNDINGAIYWNGRYHLGYLQKISNGPNQLDFSSWQHISSRDLLHWTYHKAYLSEPLEGSKGDYFNSGDAMEGMETPTIITNMPRKGICIYQCHDDNLEHWEPLAENPVISIEDGRNHSSKTLRPKAKFPDCVIFDPSGWKEGDTYYALIGNKNYQDGYEGDSTSLFKSKDLRSWKYIGPFYKSDRKWTGEEEDCACSDFFPFGQKHMLLMHTHQPYSKCQYYIGQYKNEKFYPETNGQISYQGSMLAGPETLIDGKGRRLFWGWIRDAQSTGSHGWNSIMTVPWHFTSTSDNKLKIQPVEELKALRYNQQIFTDVDLSSKDEIVIDGLFSDCMELNLTIDSLKSDRFGLKLFCSPDGEEQTTIVYDHAQKEFVVDFERSSTNQELSYPCGQFGTSLSTGNFKQTVPYNLGRKQALNLNIFVDRSVIEIFVNGDICIVQRVYPTREDSQEVRLFTKDRPIRITNITKWDMEATNPW
tara:strand:+ start:227 stop:1759 length:1533 start_codon:yes stop_codon:yes gene_type:complete